jgi:hypothetical protein
MNDFSGKRIGDGHNTVLKMIAMFILPAGNGLAAAAATINRRIESIPRVHGLAPSSSLAA